jgi:hypothetical protein
MKLILTRAGAIASRSSVHHSEYSALPLNEARPHYSRCRYIIRRIRFLGNPYNPISYILGRTVPNEGITNLQPVGTVTLAFAVCHSRVQDREQAAKAVIQGGLERQTTASLRGPISPQTCPASGVVLPADGDRAQCSRRLSLPGLVLSRLPRRIRARGGESRGFVRVGFSLWRPGAEQEEYPRLSASTRGFSGFGGVVESGIEYGADETLAPQCRPIPAPTHHRTFWERLKARNLGHNLPRPAKKLGRDDLINPVPRAEEGRFEVVSNGMQKGGWGRSFQFSVAFLPSSPFPISPNSSARRGNIRPAPDAR